MTLKLHNEMLEKNMLHLLKCFKCSLYIQCAGREVFSLFEHQSHEVLFIIMNRPLVKD